MDLNFKKELANGYTSNSQIARVIEKMPNKEFTLKDIYTFEKDLKLKYPNNNFIKDKIRQQLQLLRDREIIEFNGRGTYKKIE